MKFLILSLITLTGFVQFSLGDDSHNHEAAVEAAPLGGTLRDAPPFKSEILIKNDVVKLYIYDQKLKVLKLDKETLRGDVQFPRVDKPTPIIFKKVKEETPKVIKNVGTITERYETKISGIDKTHRYDMHVVLEVGDKKAKADFGIDNIN